MAQFKVEVVPVTIEKHDNANRLEIAQIEGTGYQSIVGKGQFEDGDLVAYIPEGSVVPENILEEMGLKGQLAGSKHNRVKAVRLRGVLSQGLCYPARDEWEVGQDVTEELGVQKYKPPIPTHMSGEIYNLGPSKTMSYDIENLKKYPDVFSEGEEVVMTEKIHGTNFQAGVLPEEDANPEYGTLVVASKGLGSKGQPFKPQSKDNEANIYLRACRQFKVQDKIEQARHDMEHEGPIFVLAEVFGIQDLSYGANPQKDSIGFAIFDVHVGYQSTGRYLDHDEMVAFCEQYDLPMVPVLYQGPFSKEAVSEHTDGFEQVTGDELHIREGIVVKPITERRHPKLGRVLLKSVSEDYLTRNSGSEYT